MFLLYAFLFLLLPLHKARQEAKRLQLKFHIMNKEKLEELEGLKTNAIMALKFALGVYSNLKVYHPKHRLT